MTDETKKELHDALFDIHLEMEMAKLKGNYDYLEKLKRELIEIKKKYGKIALAENEKEAKVKGGKRL